MAKIEQGILDAIERLSKEELKKFVQKTIQKDKFWHDYFLTNYADKESGEKDMFEKAKKDIDLLLKKNYRGPSDEMRMANKLVACSKRITDFEKLSKKKELVIGLILYVLKDAFSLPPEMFETCFTAFNHKVYLLLKKAITIYETKIHEDLKLDYLRELNQYLAFMHQHSNHLDYVYHMPHTV